MATVTLFYRDGGNYKCEWDEEIPNEIIRALPPPDSNGMYSLEQLGLEPDSIPLIAKYGLDSTSDHPYVTIRRVRYEAEWTPLNR